MKNEETQISNNVAVDTYLLFLPHRISFLHSLHPLQQLMKSLRFRFESFVERVQSEKTQFTVVLLFRSSNTNMHLLECLYFRF